MDNMSDMLSVDSASNDNTDMPLLDTSEDDDKPLLKLFKRLIGDDTKQNAVLTNAQIVYILKKEFNMDISYIHHLEIEIYLNLMKKFLKDWPQWDEFDQTIQSIKMDKAKNYVDERSKEQLELEAKYENLKMYLNKMLETAKPLIKNAVDEVKRSQSTNPWTGGTVVLEVNCTRDQLKGLFFRRPHPDYNNTIFNIEPIRQPTCQYKHTLKSIFNWPRVQVLVNLGSVSFKRETTPVVTRRLVNRNLNWKKPPEELNVQLHTKDSRTNSLHTIEEFLSALEQPLPTTISQDTRKAVTVITEIISANLIHGLNVSTACVFRQTMSRYPYVRYYYADVDSSKDNQPKTSSISPYDLQMEETIVPRFFLQILKFDKFTKGSSPLKFTDHWLNVKCLECNVVFSDNNFRIHFDECHRKEKQWQCMRCGKSIDMVVLSINDWKHTCLENL